LLDFLDGARFLPRPPPLVAVVKNLSGWALERAKIIFSAPYLSRMPPPLTRRASSRHFARSMALLSAAELDDPAAIRALATSGAALDALHPCGATALTAAARSGSERALEALLQCGADVDSRGAEGETALIKAARNGHLGCAQLLLQSGANPHAACFERGWSALHWAGARKNVGLGLLLVAAGADPMAPSSPLDDSPGQTPGELALRLRGDALFGELIVASRAAPQRKAFKPR
jgi:ankyrin repeat protein